MSLNISWALLTFNRADTVIKAVPDMFQKSGYPINELCWCDNGSSPADGGAIADCLSRDIPILNTVSILNSHNLGVDKGYNRAIAMTTGEWILITGCDRIMPDNWLKKMVDVINADPDVKVVSIYSQPIDKCRERVKGEKYELGGHSVQTAMPFGARIFHRDLLYAAGYFRQDFGLYGWSDVEFSERQMKVCNQKSWDYVVMLDVVAQHLGDEGNGVYKGLDPDEYWQFKKLEVKDPKKQEVLKFCREKNYPRFNPYSGEV
jgi:GT2 family glycosyltransferase